ncbi:hypothetical protein [Paenibacillus sp. y28]|uniref:hypothetical protein n=1 Tax=Paenibacillus sp. y28 TaxID=3129110 RepID=UPI003019223E
MKKMLLTVVVLGAIYAVIGEIIFYTTYFYLLDVSDEIGWYFIAGGLGVLYTLLIVRYFRNRHWYGVLFIPVAYFLFLVIFSMVISQFFPIEEGHDGIGLLLIFVHIFHLIIIGFGIVAGLVANLIILQVKGGIRCKGYSK